MLIRIIGTAILSLCVVLFLKRIDSSLALIAGAGCGIILTVMILSRLEGFVSYYYTLCEERGYGEYFTVMLKGLGIALLTQTGADICHDSGESALASRIELAGKAEILVITLPLVKSLVALSESILN